MGSVEAIHRLHSFCKFYERTPLTVHLDLIARTEYYEASDSANNGKNSSQRLTAKEHT